MKNKVANLFFSVLLLLCFNVSAQSVRSELYFTDPEKLPKTLNADQSEEVFLLFSRDSATLYFVRQHDPENEGFKENNEDQDIWYTRKDKTGQYELAKDMHQFNNKLNNGVVGMSLDGNSIYLLDVYNKRNKNDKGIAVSRRSKGGSWGSPTKVEIPGLKIEGEHWGFYVNPQETIMILSFEGKDTKGQEDLYVILKDKDGKWTTPVSLGDKINTQGFEISPYLSEDGYTLFWSTDGRAGQGDADIWASFRTDDGWVNWSEPVNMGPKINSPQFDAYFIITANDAWWASNRDGISCDIYHARAIEPEPVEDTIKEIVNVVEPIDTHRVVSNEIPKLPQFIEVKLFFARNSSWIEPDAKRVADSVIALMKARPEVVAEVHAHADARASAEYNVWLTKRRANRVIEYMVLSGIDKKRLSANWYGKTQLAVECNPCTEEQYKASRRTVIKLSKIE